MRPSVFLLLVAIASVADCYSLAVAEKTIQHSQDSVDGLHNHNTARHLRGTLKIDAADEEERGPTQILSKLKSILGRNPDKISKKKLEKVRSYAEENPDKWYDIAFYLDLFYSISFVALLTGGAIWGYNMRPAGMGGPNTN